MAQYLHEEGYTSYGNVGCTQVFFWLHDVCTANVVDSWCCACGLCVCVYVCVGTGVCMGKGFCICPGVGEPVASA